MAQQIDWSILDQPELLEFVFYPRKDWRPPPAGGKDYLVPVAAGVSIACRFYALSPQLPSVLFFHGNGEVVSDYDQIAPLYHHGGANLFVADYRGYGRSGGSPTFSAMIADAHPILHFCREALNAEGCPGPLFVMGRSLGSYSAVELAAAYPETLRGLIVESGSANPLRLLRLLGLPADQAGLEGLEKARQTRLRSLTLPVLVIHGEQDALIPLSEAVNFYHDVASPDKELVVIPGAGHNDILLVGMEEYLKAMRDFVSR